VIRGYPNDGDMHYNYANALQHSNRIDEAIVEYKKELQLFPGRSRERTVYNLGVAYLTTGNLELAERCFNEILKADTPTARELWPGATQNLKYIALSRRPQR